MDKLIYQIPEMEYTVLDLGLGAVLCASPMGAQTEGFTEYELFEDQGQ